MPASKLRKLATCASSFSRSGDICLRPTEANVSDYCARSITKKPRLVSLNASGPPEMTAQIISVKGIAIPSRQPCSFPGPKNRRSCRGKSSGHPRTLPDPTIDRSAPRPVPSLSPPLQKADFGWMRLSLETPSTSSRSQNAKSATFDKVNMTISLAFLAPSLVQAAVDGRLFAKLACAGNEPARLCVNLVYSPSRKYGPEYGETFDGRLASILGPQAPTSHFSDWIMPRSCVRYATSFERSLPK